MQAALEYLDVVSRRRSAGVRRKLGQQRRIELVFPPICPHPTHLGLLRNLIGDVSRRLDDERVVRQESIDARTGGLELRSVFGEDLGFELDDLNVREGLAL